MRINITLAYLDAWLHISLSVPYRTGRPQLVYPYRSPNQVLAHFRHPKLHVATLHQMAVNIALESRTHSRASFPPNTARRCSSSNPFSISFSNIHMYSSLLQVNIISIPRHHKLYVPTFPAVFRLNPKRVRC